MVANSKHSGDPYCSVKTTRHKFPCFLVFKSCLLSYHLGGSVVVNIQDREKRTWWSCFRALWRCRRRGPRWVWSTCAAPQPWMERRTGALDNWLLDHVGGGLPPWMVPTPKVSSTSHLSFGEVSATAANPICSTFQNPATKPGALDTHTLRHNC